MLPSTEMDVKFTVVFEPCQEGGYHAFIEELPGVHSEGETIEEAHDNLVDAFREVLAYRVEEKLATQIGPFSRLEVQLADRE